MKKLNITFCSFPDYSSNSKPLYEYIKKRYSNKMNLVWIVNSEEKLYQLKQKGIRCYKLGTKEYYEYIKKSDIIFSTHANLTADKPDNCIYIELWHGIGMKPIGYLCENFTESEHEWYKYVIKRIDYFIVPSEFWKVIFSSLFNFNAKRILPLGYPKLDEINNKNAMKCLEQLYPGIKSYDKILYYMPTYRMGLERVDSECNINNIFNFETYDEKILLDFLMENNYLLCIKYHPSEENLIKRIESKNIIYLEDDLISRKNISISEILNASDLLITDYSSVGVEYTFLNKPIIYLSNDLKDYQKNRGIIFGNYNFWAKNQSENIINLLQMIKHKLTQKYEISHNKELFFGKLKNGGCNKICNYLFENNNLKSTITPYLSEEKKLEGIVEELIDKEKNYKNKIVENENLYKNQIEKFTKNETEYKNIIKNYEEKEKEYKSEINKLEENKKNLEDIINKIYNSKSWKIISFIRTIKNWRK